MATAFGVWSAERATPCRVCLSVLLRMLCAPRHAQFPLSALYAAASSATVATDDAASEAVVRPFGVLGWRPGEEEEDEFEASEGEEGGSGEPPEDRMVALRRDAMRDFSAEDIVGLVGMVLQLVKEIDTAGATAAGADAAATASATATATASGTEMEQGKGCSNAAVYVEPTFAEIVNRLRNTLARAAAHVSALDKSGDAGEKEEEERKQAETKRQTERAERKARRVTRRLRGVLSSLRSPHDLFDLVDVLRQPFQPTRATSLLPGYDGTCRPQRISVDSPMGVFLRHVLLDCDALSFRPFADLYADVAKYAAAASSEMVAPSQRQANAWTEAAVRALDENLGASSHLETENLVRRVLAVHPHVPMAHMLRHINAASALDDEAAESSLHRYFDYPLNPFGPLGLGVSAQQQAHAQLGQTHQTQSTQQAAQVAAREAVTARTAHIATLHLAAAHIRLGRLRDARRAVEEAIRVAQQNGQHECMAMALLYLHVLLAHENHPQAGECLVHALHVCATIRLSSVGAQVLLALARHLVRTLPMRTVHPACPPEPFDASSVLWLLRWATEPAPDLQSALAAQAGTGGVPTAAGGGSDASGRGSSTSSASASSGAAPTAPLTPTVARQTRAAALLVQMQLWDAQGFRSWARRSASRCLEFYMQGTTLDAATMAVTASRFAITALHGPSPPSASSSSSSLVSVSTTGIDGVAARVLQRQQQQPRCRYLPALLGLSDCVSRKCPRLVTSRPLIRSPMQAAHMLALDWSLALRDVCSAGVLLASLQELCEASVEDGPEPALLAALTRSRMLDELNDDLSGAVAIAEQVRQDARLAGLQAVVTRATVHLAQLKLKAHLRLAMHASPTTSDTVIATAPSLVSLAQLSPQEQSSCPVLAAELSVSLASAILELLLALANSDAGAGTDGEPQSRECALATWLPFCANALDHAAPLVLQHSHVRTQAQLWVAIGRQHLLALRSQSGAGCEDEDTAQHGLWALHAVLEAQRCGWEGDEVSALHTAAQLALDVCAALPPELPAIQAVAARNSQLTQRCHAYMAEWSAEQRTGAFHPVRSAIPMQTFDQHSQLHRNEQETTCACLWDLLYCEK